MLYVLWFVTPSLFQGENRTKIMSTDFKKKTLLPVESFKEEKHFVMAARHSASRNYETHAKHFVSVFLLFYCKKSTGI